jgi:hypothetical protein
MSWLNKRAAICLESTGIHWSNNSNSFRLGDFWGYAGHPDSTAVRLTVYHVKDTGSRVIFSDEVHADFTPESMAELWLKFLGSL